VLTAAADVVEVETAVAGEVVGSVVDDVRPNCPSPSMSKQHNQRKLPDTFSVLSTFPSLISQSPSMVNVGRSSLTCSL
jgi:hypothetical protein